MIKRIIIISVLMFTFLFASFYIQQKRAEAVVPIVLYVAISALIHFTVGAYIYLQSQSGGNDEGQEITNINAETGEITIEFVNNIESGATGVPVYPSATIQTGCDYFQQNFDPNDGQAVSDATRQNVFNYYTGGSSYYGDPILYYTIGLWNQFPTVSWWRATSHTGSCVGEIPADFNEYTYDVNGGSLGGSYLANLDGEDVEMYEFIEDVPLLPTCFDGIQNQDETGIDCGGVCEINFSFVCPPGETCFDGIMNQDETGIDYGGVCGIGGEESPAGPEPTNFVDVNVDGIDDISGYDSVGNVPIGAPGDADSNTFDTSLPGDISEVGETNWIGLITGYLATNPLVLLATGSSINLSSEVCTLTANVFGTDVIIDFCPMESMIDLIGTFVLALFTIRSVFIAMGI